MNVLIVDDDPQIRQTLSLFLKRTGWNIRSADNCRQAIELLDDSIDVVLSDIKLGEQSGIELLRLVRDRFPFLEVIMMTGYADIRDSIAALNLRAFGFLRKPFDLAELNQMLLKAARAKDANQHEAFYKQALEEQVAKQTRRLMIEKERFKSIFAAVPSLLLIMDGEYRLAAGNRQLELFTGQPVEAMVGREASLLLGYLPERPEWLERLPREESPFHELLSQVTGGASEVARGQVSLPVAGPGGHVRKIFRASCCLLPGPAVHEPFLLLMLDDITREKELEVQLIHSGRMSALGEMASGVAHELNQPLNGIAAYVQLIQSRLLAGRATPPEELSQFCRDLMHEVERMSQIINHLRIFYRSGNLPRRDEPLSLENCYRDAMKMLQHQLMNHGITLEEDFPPGLPLVAGDQCRFEQVFMNLIVNARDALNELGGGRKIIRVSACGCEAEGCPGVRVEVRDSGAGIAPENLEKIFDPFFSTKEPGKGTGLGLAISSGIIGESGGYLRAESTLGQGTVFQFWLPAMATETEHRQALTIAREDG